MDNLHIGNSTDIIPTPKSNLIILIIFLFCMICGGSVNYMKNKSQNQRRRRGYYENPEPVPIPVPVPLNEGLPRYENIEGPPSYDSIT